jgi:hypothetical protein
MRGAIRPFREVDTLRIARIAMRRKLHEKQFNACKAPCAVGVGSNPSMYSQKSPA